MFYTLRFESRFGLWRLKVENFRERWFTSRYEVEKLVDRYQRWTQRKGAHGEL